MTETFPRSGRWASGYDVEQVDEFFERARAAYEADPSLEEMSAEEVRAAAFDLVRHGYDPGHVDAALDRLEGAFVQRARARSIGADRSGRLDEQRRSAGHHAVPTAGAARRRAIRPARAGPRLRGRRRRCAPGPD